MKHEHVKKARGLLKIVRIWIGIEWFSETQQATKGERNMKNPVIWKLHFPLLVELFQSILPVHIFGRRVC
jgi:hypothetical protein